MTLRLVIFDVDGTLVDSQADILAAMSQAFAAVGRPVPTRAEVLGIVGLSLPQAMAALAPDAGADTRDQMVAAYKSAYMRLRVQSGVELSSPLYPYVRDVLEALHAQNNTLLGLATGKSRRGLDKLVDGHGLRQMFLTQHCADDHPSKPHPSMLMAAMADVGVDPDQAVMVGDTSFDMDMARSAGITGIGVSWGYHPRARLSGADHIIDDIRDLGDVLNRLWGPAS